MKLPAACKCIGYTLMNNLIRLRVGRIFHVIKKLSFKK